MSGHVLDVLVPPDSLTPDEAEIWTAAIEAAKAQLALAADPTAAALARIADAQERIAAALEFANTPEPEPTGCPHPVEAREPVNGWHGFFCLACETKVGRPIGASE